MALQNDANLTQLSESQADKYLTSNEDDLRNALGANGRLTIDFPSDANYTLNASDNDGTEEWRYKFLIFTDVAAPLNAARDVIMPAKGPVWRVHNKTGFTLTFKISGQTGVDVADGVKSNIYYDEDAGDIVAY